MEDAVMEVEEDDEEVDEEEELLLVLLVMLGVRVLPDDADDVATFDWVVEDALFA